jgi:hypothetical protein
MLEQRKVRMGMPWIRVEFGELYWISLVTAFFWAGYESGRYQVEYGLAYVIRVCIRSFA